MFLSGLLVSLEDDRFSSRDDLLDDFVTFTILSASCKSFECFFDVDGMSNNASASANPMPLDPSTSSSASRFSDFLLCRFSFNFELVLDEEVDSLCFELLEESFEASSSFGFLCDDE